MPDEIRFEDQEPLKYEGVVSLIITQFRDMKIDNDKAFDRLHKNNDKQNGNIAGALKKATENELEIVRLKSKLIVSEQSHINNCPQSEKIRKLEDGALTNKSIRSWILKSVSITGGIMASLWIVFQLITNAG